MTILQKRLEFRKETVKDRIIIKHLLRMYRNVMMYLISVHVNYVSRNLVFIFDVIP